MQEKQHAYYPETFESAHLRSEEIEQEIAQTDRELGRLASWGRLLADEFKAAIQRSDSALQQLKNHLDMDGLFW